MKLFGEIVGRLSEINADKRYHYPAADVSVNAPLALIQVELKAEAKALAWVLEVDPPKFGPKKKGKESLTEEIERLTKTVNPRARVPSGFGLWSAKMVVGWLRQNQRKDKKKW